MTVMNFIRKILGKELDLPSVVTPILPKVYVAIAAILKNEAPYIKEWIEYHKCIGIERFYLYDNASTDNVLDVLQPYINDGTVIYRYIAQSKMQAPVYKDAIYYYRNDTRWLALIDLDEFIVPVEHDNIKDFLRNYEKYPAVGINWLLFDSNGYETKPEGLVIENFTRVDYDNPSNLHIKSIVNPKEVFDLCNPHYCLYRMKKSAVNENYEPIEGPMTQKLSIKKIRINHYLSKSKEEYINKIKRGRAVCDELRPYIERDLNFTNYTYDNIIYKYLDKLKQAMGDNV